MMMYVRLRRPIVRRLSQRVRAVPETPSLRIRMRMKNGVKRAQTYFRLPSCGGHSSGV